MQKKIQINLANLLLSLSDAIDLAHPDISLHQIRTAFISWELCTAAGYSDEFLKDVFIAALFHDAGAITIEEKVNVHNFENVDPELHCIRGEILLRRIPFFENISKIVRYHHRGWDTWGDDKDTPCVMSSQVVLMADHIERLIQRDKYILHQSRDIITVINNQSGKTFNPELVRIFNSIAGREDFWLDLISPRLYSLLFHKGPLRSIEIDFSYIEGISKFFRDIIDFKSPFTATHTSGVSACAELLSKLFNLSETEVFHMKIAGNLHDIGKLIIPNSILDKPDKLTPDEFAVIKCHTYYSFEVINSVIGLQEIAEWAAFHHEKLNGKGYPFHYGEKNLTIGSRIMMVADIYTAISEDRPYRSGMSKDQIYDVFKKEVAAGSLDKGIVELLFDNYALINEHVKMVQAAAYDFYETRLIGFR